MKCFSGLVVCGLRRKPNLILLLSFRDEITVHMFSLGTYLTTGIPYELISLTDHETSRSEWDPAPPCTVLTQGLAHDRHPPNTVQGIEMQMAGDGAVEE